MKPMNGRPLTEVFSDSSGVLSPRPDREVPPPSIGKALPIGNDIYMTPTGAIIDQDVSFDDFCIGLQNCQKVANGAMWTLGDLLVYGEGRGEWGHMYTQALDLTKKSYSTLTAAVRLSKAYPIEERVEDVSWSHHREALAEKDPALRRDILVQAADAGLSREGVRALISGETPPTPATKTCPKCGHEW